MKKHDKVHLEPGVAAALHKLNQTLVLTAREMNAIIATALERAPDSVAKITFQPPIRDKIQIEQVRSATDQAPGAAAQFQGDSGPVTCLCNLIKIVDGKGIYVCHCFDPETGQVYSV